VVAAADPRPSIIERLPTVDEHRRLFAVQGWDWYGAERVAAGLLASTHGAVAEVGGHVVGMGRVVGDGATFHYLQDVVVDPNFRGRGLGDMIVRSLLGQIGATDGAPGVVGLFATRSSIEFYRRLGFGEPELHGMARWLSG